MPLSPSSPPVSRALFRLSRKISLLTWQAAYAPFKPSDSEQRSHGSSYRGCWHELSPCFLQGSINLAVLSPSTVLYNPKAFIAHAASLGQACAHCRRSSTAATRRCLASVSVPVARVVLSHPLRIFALVGRYPANKLIRHEPLSRRNPFLGKSMPTRQIAGNYPSVRTAMPIPEVGCPCITAPFATQSGQVLLPGRLRSTCMPNPRRQRSF